MDSTRVVRQVFPREPAFSSWPPIAFTVTVPPPSDAPVWAQGVNAPITPTRRTTADVYRQDLNPEQGWIWARVSEVQAPQTPAFQTETAQEWLLSRRTPLDVRNHTWTMGNDWIQQPTVLSIQQSLAAWQAETRQDFLLASRRQMTLLRDEWSAQPAWQTAAFPTFDARLLPRMQESVVARRERSILFDAFRRGMALVTLPYPSGSMIQETAETGIKFLNSRHRTPHFLQSWEPQPAWQTAALPVFDARLFPRVHEPFANVTGLSRETMKPQHQDWLERLDWAYGVIAPQIASWAGVFAHQVQQQLLMRQPPILDVYRQWVHEHPEWISRQIDIQQARYAGTYQTQREQAFLIETRRKLIQFREEWLPRLDWIGTSVDTNVAVQSPAPDMLMKSEYLLPLRRKLTLFREEWPSQPAWITTPVNTLLGKQWPAIEALLRSEILLAPRRKMTLFREEWSAQTGWETVPNAPVFDARLLQLMRDLPWLWDRRAYPPPSYRATAALEVPPDGIGAWDNQPRQDYILAKRRQLTLFLEEWPSMPAWINAPVTANLTRQWPAIEALLRSEMLMSARRKMTLFREEWSPEPAWLTATLSVYDARLFPRTQDEMVRQRQRLHLWTLNSPERLDWLRTTAVAPLPRQWAAMDELLRSEYLLLPRRKMTLFREEWSPEPAWITTQALRTVPQIRAAIEQLLRNEYRLGDRRSSSVLLQAYMDVAWRILTIIITEPLIVFVAPQRPTAIISTVDIMTFTGPSRLAMVTSLARDVMFIAPVRGATIVSAVDLMTFRAPERHTAITSAAR